MEIYMSELFIEKKLSPIGKLVFSNFSITKNHINIKLPYDIVAHIDKIFIMLKEENAEKYVDKIIALSWDEPYCNNSKHLEPFIKDIIDNKKLCLKILIEKDENFRNVWYSHKGDTTRNTKIFTHPSHTWLSSLCLAWVYIRVH